MVISLKRILILPFLALLVAAGPKTPEALPTVEEARADFKDGKYKETVRLLAKIVASREWQAKKFDRFDVLSLKAEAHLQMKESNLAATTFDAAAKSTDDRTLAAVARTTAYLIKHSTGTHYLPKATANQHVPGKGPNEHITFDIIDPESRKQALTALWQDEHNIAEPKFKAATEGESMQAVLDAVGLINPLREFDIAAHGNDNDTKQTADQIVSHARDLLMTLVERMSARIDQINAKAMKYDTFKIQGQTTWRRHGMESKEPEEAKEIASNTDKITTVIKLMDSTLALDLAYFDPILQKTRHAHEKAQATLDENYGQTYYTRPTD